MKTLNKLFAIAAIAAASMFSAQNASAAVLDDGTTTETEMPTKCGITFEKVWGSDWAEYDAMLVGNANSCKIVEICVEMCNKHTAGTLTNDEFGDMLNELYNLNCPEELAAHVMYIVMFE